MHKSESSTNPKKLLKSNIFKGFSYKKDKNIVAKRYMTESEKTIILIVNIKKPHKPIIILYY